MTKTNPPSSTILILILSLSAVLYVSDAVGQNCEISFREKCLYVGQIINFNGPQERIGQIEVYNSQNSRVKLYQGTRNTYRFTYEDKFRVEYVGIGVNDTCRSTIYIDIKKDPDPIRVSELSELTQCFDSRGICFIDSIPRIIDNDTFSYLYVNMQGLRNTYQSQFGDTICLTNPLAFIPKPQVGFRTKGGCYWEQYLRTYTLSSQGVSLIKNSHPADRSIATITMICDETLERVDSFLFDWGDGNQVYGSRDSNQNFWTELKGSGITHHYNMPGTYRISMKIYFEDGCLAQDSSVRISYPFVAKGSVYYDRNKNGVLDKNEFGFLSRIASSKSFTQTTYDGEYVLGVTINEADSLVAEIPAIWKPYLAKINPTYHEVRLMDSSSVDTSGLDFGVQLNATPCSYVDLDVVLNRLRLCSEGAFKVRVANIGLKETRNFVVNLELPKAIKFLDASHGAQKVGDGLYQFTIDSLMPGELMVIHVRDSIKCEQDYWGEMQCVKVWLDSSNSCVEEVFMKEWEGGDIKVKASCIDSNSASYTILNTGRFAKDMKSISKYRLYRSSRLFFDGEFKLDAGDSVVITTKYGGYQDGADIRFEADQEVGYPVESIPTAYMGGCVSKEMNQNSIEHDDRSKAVEYDCAPIVGSYDPNDKSASPKGETTLNFIKSSSELEYTIRFQNTGTDTAYDVIIVDELDKNLDESTLEMISSSHAYRLEADLTSKPSRLLFHFEGIYLPDSGIDQEGSNGYIRFRIKLNSSVKDWDNIFNSAEIYFDRNAPIHTNSTRHIVADALPSSDPPVDIWEDGNIRQRVIHQTDTVCFGRLTPSGTGVWSESGSYLDTVYTENSRQLWFVDLTVHRFDNVVLTVDGRLKAKVEGARYQWLSCTDGTYTNIGEATNQTFIPKMNGDYAVQITKENCVDTSDCIRVGWLSNNSPDQHRIGVYPNPASQKLQIVLLPGMTPHRFEIVNAIGSLVGQFDAAIENEHIIQLNLPPGRYWLKCIQQDGAIDYTSFIVN